MSYYEIDELYQVKITPRDKYIIRNIYDGTLILIIIVFLHMLFLGLYN